MQTKANSAGSEKYLNVILIQKQYARDQCTLPTVSHNAKHRNSRDLFIPFLEMCRQGGRIWKHTGSVSEGSETKTMYIMDSTPPLSPTLRKWSQIIPCIDAAILHWWGGLKPESVQLCSRNGATVSSFLNNSMVTCTVWPGSMYGTVFMTYKPATRGRAGSFGFIFDELLWRLSVLCL